MQTLFLIFWSGLFVLAAYFLWVKMVKHIKVYLLMAFNCLYLVGIFWGLPHFG